MQEASQAPGPVARFLLVLCLAVAWFVVIALGGYWMMGEIAVPECFFAYVLSGTFLHCYLRGPQIEPFWAPFWFIGILLGWNLAGFALTAAISYLFDVPGLRDAPLAR